MNSDIAMLIFMGIMTVAVLVWLWSLQLALSIGRSAAKPDWRMLDMEQDSPTDVESDERTVRGSPEKLSAALARSMVQINVGTFSSLFEIVERTPERILVKKTGPLMGSQPAGLYFSEAEINFKQLGNDITRVSYVLGYDRLARRVKRVALAIILGIGLPVMIIVGSLVWHYVLPSQNPAVQWQVLQTLQVSHALWPPFLFLGLYSAGRRQSKTYFSNLLSTLELAE